MTEILDELEQMLEDENGRAENLESFDSGKNSDTDKESKLSHKAAGLQNLM